MNNNSGADIDFGGYYSYTYENKKGIWRNVPMQFIVFAEETMLQQGNTHYYNAEMFRRNVVSYLAVNHGIVQSATPFTVPAFLNTLQISMKTDIVVYPVGTKSVSVSLNIIIPKSCSLEKIIWWHVKKTINGCYRMVTMLGLI